MSEVLIKATERPGTTQNSLTLLRQQGQVPGVIYGHKVPTRSIQVEVRGLQEALQHASASTILKLSLGGNAPLNVMIKEVQVDAITRRPRHIDFQAIDMNEEVHVTIPVHLHGEAPGVKNGGGVLQIGAREIEVRALPGNLPESFIVDISGLDFGHHLSVKDLTIPAGVELISDPDLLVVGVSASNTTDEDVPDTEIVAGGADKAVATEPK